MRESKFRSMTPIGVTAAARQPHRERDTERINLVRMSVLVIGSLLLYGAFHFLARTGPSPVQNNDDFGTSTVKTPPTIDQPTNEVKPPIPDTTVGASSKLLKTDMSDSLETGRSTDMSSSDTDNGNSESDNQQTVQDHAQDDTEVR
eukprot:TRINITY_DN3038_c0_g1_i1.p1 TRINITY_DN3038_c0_g1~~TRINITY_DN3038_c0_g1_i1.p1  ORF type:complete len:146 (+),score=9.00 TRINITY_DN3038_c0_g1_i1:68-505(+)